MNYTNKRPGWINTSNVYIFLLCKAVAVLLLLWLTQIFFYCCNTRLFHVASDEWSGIIWGNVVVGLITIVYLMLPYFAAYLLPFKCRHKRSYQLAVEWLFFIIPLLFLSIANCCDAAYFQFTYRRLTGEIFHYLGISGDIWALLPHFVVDFWYTFVGILVSLTITLLISSRIRLYHRNKFGNQRANNRISLALSIVCLALFVYHLPCFRTHYIDPAKYCTAQHCSLVSNSGYNVFCTLFDGGRLQEDRMMDQSAARQLFDPSFRPTHRFDAETRQGWYANGGFYSPADTLSPFSYFPEFPSAGRQHRNVVVIVMESFSQEYMGCYNKEAERSYTPFLDSLSQHCIVYQGRANGKKSIEGIPAIFTSLPNLMAFPVSMTRYGNDSLNSLPAILGHNGYHTAFFHGSHNGVMRFDRLCQRMGFDEYYGKDEYMADRFSQESDYDGCWGIFDEPYLQYMSRRLSTFHEPFFAGVFTTSSHHPYTMAPDHEGDFTGGPHPHLRVVEYADNALRQFFKSAEQTDWFRHTTFIITADHCGPALAPEYNTYSGWYRIPLMVYIPGSNEARVSNRLVQQTDIMPTLLDYLGIPATTVCFGTSLFRNPNQGWSIAYGNGYYQLETQQGMAVKSNETEEQTGNCNIDLLKSVIQQYNTRLIHNQLTK